MQLLIDSYTQLYVIVYKFYFIKNTYVRLNFMRKYLGVICLYIEYINVYIYRANKNIAKRLKQISP